MDAAPRRLKKRNRKDFEDLEAEEKSDDSDIEAEAAGARGSDVLPREVAELQREMDARPNAGARGYAANLASMEKHYLREHRAELAAKKEELDDFLIPEADVKAGRHAVKSSSSQQSLRSPKQRRVDADEDAQSVRKSEAESRRSRIHESIDSAHKTLPTASDPKLWRVKCYKTGYEKEFCANLINKFWHMVQTEGESYLQEIPIYSIFAADAAKGYIYVEAHREIDVRNYIKGIRALGAWNIHLVPTKEMIGVFNMASFVESQSKGNLRPGSWVRLSRGIYKQDVAMVLRVFDGAAQVRIKPRVNFENEASGKKPRQEFFSLETCKALPHVAFSNTTPARKKVCDIACFEVGGETYTCDSGHLIKSISRAGFSTDCQTTLAEEEAFSNPLAPEAYSKDFAPGTVDTEQGLRQVYRRNKDAVRGGTRQKRFFKGERVRVKTGQLAGLHCKVVEVLPNDVLRLEAEYASAEWKRLNGIESGLIEYPCGMVEKYFEMGNRVKILGGEHTGETGTISSVVEKDRCCTVVSETMENERGFPIEFKVSTWDLTCTTEKKTTKVENYGFKIGDLVNGPGKMVGIVTSLGRNSLRVLTEQGLLRDWSYKQMSLEKKFSDRAPDQREKMNEWVLDRRGQRICRTYQVTVFATAKRRRMVGTVVHLVRESTSGAERVFVHDSMTLGEEKYVIALARECETRTATPPMSSYESQKMAFAAIGDEEKLKEIECDTSDLPKKKFLKQGRRVKIVSGPYKGLLAEIRSEIDEHYVRVQLLIKPKMMQVHKRTIQFCDMRAGGNMLADMPPTVPPTPLPAEMDDDKDADPWDVRFKLPAPVRKKAEIAWDPTYRKIKLVQQPALPAPTSASEQLEDEIASQHSRQSRRTINERQEETVQPEPEKLLELMDTADESPDSPSAFQSAVDISMDELLSNPVPIE